jgi:integrase
MSAIRKLASKAAGNGLLAPELGAGIARVKSAKSVGTRTGNWLSACQAQRLLNAPDVSTLRGLRDRAILAVLLGCGLRRSEVAALTFAHIQQRDGRWCIVDLVGKHGRVRTADAELGKVAIDSWTTPVGIWDGHIFRLVIPGDRLSGIRLGEKVVWQMLREYAAEIGIPGLAPTTFVAPARVVLRCWRRTGANPDAARPRLRANDGAIPWGQAIRLHVAG